MFDSLTSLQNSDFSYINKSISVSNLSLNFMNMLTCRTIIYLNVINKEHRSFLNEGATKQTTQRGTRWEELLKRDRPSPATKEFLSNHAHLVGFLKALRQGKKEGCCCCGQKPNLKVSEKPSNESWRRWNSQDPSEAADSCGDARRGGRTPPIRLQPSSSLMPAFPSPTDMLFSETNSTAASSIVPYIEYSVIN